jgi:integrase
VNTALVVLPDAGSGGADSLLVRLQALLDPAFLALVAWDAGDQVATLPADHPLLGYPACRAEGCASTAYHASRICRGCQTRLARAGLGPDDLQLLPARQRRHPGPCAVHGCERISLSATGLCVTHSHQQRYVLQLPVAEFLADPRVTPMPRCGPCMVSACTRDRRATRGSYCAAHEQRWRADSRRHPGLDEHHWRLSAAPVTEPGKVSLRGLAPLLAAQLLFGLQQRTRSGRKMNDDQLRALCNLLRRLQVASIEDVEPAALPAHVRAHVRSFATELRQALADPETEKVKDVWELAAFGHRGTLSFTQISQPWLREAAKRWAADDLPTRRGTGGRQLRSQVGFVAWLSESLRMRTDRGLTPPALGRPDIEDFCNRLAFRESAGQISGDARIRAIQELKTILTRMRALGLTRPGGPAAGLGDDFFVLRSDIPAIPDGEPGRDLPLEVMRQLCEHLPKLEDFTSAEVRVAVELLIDTGRRPEEICGLAFDCLHRDSDDTPVLVYDNTKANRLGRRLPIPEATATLITAQQQRVRARYPNTLIGELKLLPANRFPREGRRAISDENLRSRHRLWVGSLPVLRTADDSEFDKGKIVPYAYRHTYAQRHADAGVAPDVLRELMDHRDLKITQRYYRVGEKRRREAVDRVAAMQFDRHGNRAWRQAKALLDSEHARRAVGEVVVPFGVCAEPSNVKAGGHACPYRFRCVGCDHFRTDVSYLPDLQAHLDDLLRNRERLAAATDVEEWARVEAMPSTEEITRVRRLIGRIKTDLDALSTQDRQHIDQAVATIRRTRTVALGMPRQRQPLSDIRPERGTA